MEEKTSIKIEEKKFETNNSNSFVDSETELCVAHTLSLLRNSIPQKNSLNLNDSTLEKINCDENNSNTLTNINPMVMPLYLEMREENDNIKNIPSTEEINSDTASSSIDLSSNPNSVSPINVQSSENHHQPVLSIVNNSTQKISNLSQINCNNNTNLLPDYLPQLNNVYTQQLSSDQNSSVDSKIAPKTSINKTKEEILSPNYNQKNDKKKNNKKYNLITSNSIPREIFNNNHSLIYEGARFYSFNEFRTIFMEWREQNYHPFRVASSETLRTPEDGEVYEDFKYRYIVYHCAYYGRPRQRGNGKRPNQNYLPCGCKAMLRLNFSHCDHCLKITTLRCEHNGHAVSASSFARVCAKIRKTTNKPSAALIKKPLTLNEKSQLNSPNINDATNNYVEKTVSNSNLYYNCNIQNIANPSHDLSLIYSPKENNKSARKTVKKQRFSTYQQNPNSVLSSKNFHNHLNNSDTYGSTIDNKIEKNYYKSEQLNDVDGLELSIMAVAAAMSSSSVASSMGSPSTSTASAKSDQISSNLSSSSSSAIKNFETNASNDIEMTNLTVSTPSSASFNSISSSVNASSISNNINQNTLSQVFCDLVNQNCFQNKTDQKNNMALPFNAYSLSNSNLGVKAMMVSPNVSLHNSKNSLNEILNNKNDLNIKTNNKNLTTSLNQLHENSTPTTSTTTSLKIENSTKKTNINTNGMQSLVNSLNYSTKFASNVEQQQQILSNLLSSVAQSQQQQKQQYFQNNLTNKKEIVGVIKPINSCAENFLLNPNNANTKNHSQTEEQQSAPTNKNNLTSIIQEILDSAAKNNNITNTRQYNQQIPTGMQQPTFPLHQNPYGFNNNSKDSLFNLLNQNQFSKPTTTTSLPTISTALANLLSVSQQNIHHNQQQNLIRNVLDNVFKQQTDKLTNNGHFSAFNGLQSIFSQTNLIENKITENQIADVQANLFLKKTENNDVVIKAYEEGEHLLRKIKTYLYKTKNAPEFVDRLQKLVSLIVDIDKEVA